jgi:hypothetical protein
LTGAAGALSHSPVGSEANVAFRFSKANEGWVDAGRSPLPALHDGDERRDTIG